LKAKTGANKQYPPNNYSLVLNHPFKAKFYLDDDSDEHCTFV
jgi:hypothetical protein